MFFVGIQKSNSGNQSHSIEAKIADKHCKPYDDEGRLKIWVICLFIKLELNLGIDKINVKCESNPPNASIFKRGLNCAKIKKEFLTLFLDVSRETAEVKFKDKFRLSAFAMEIFDQDFFTPQDIKNYLFKAPLIQAHNLNTLTETIQNNEAYKKLLDFFDNDDYHIALLSGPTFSGKSSSMSRVYKHLVKTDLTNVVYLDISTITDVARFQRLLHKKIKQAFVELRQNDIDDLTLVELLNLRTEWNIQIDTGNRSVFGAGFERFVSQNDYISFFKRIITKASGKVNVVISEQFSHRNLPQYLQNQITTIDIKPDKVFDYIEENHNLAATTKQKKKFLELSKDFNSWSEEQCFIYSHFYKLFAQAKSLEEYYKEVNYALENQLDLNTLLIKYIEKTAPNDLALNILHSLVLIEEGFQYTTLASLLVIFRPNGEFNLDTYILQNPLLFDWLSLFTTEKISHTHNMVMLQPALRSVLYDGGLKAPSTVIENLIDLTCKLNHQNSPSSLESLVFNSDLSKPENYLSIHNIVLPGIHTFKLMLTQYQDESANNEDPVKLENVIKNLYFVYDRQIELNQLDMRYKKSAFALGKIFLSYDVKLKLVSDIISLNNGYDNGRLLTKDCSLVKALEVDQIFYLLESLSVSSIATLKYGSIAKASYLLASLLQYIDFLHEKEQNTDYTSVAIRAQSRIYQNDILLKLYFNPQSTSSPTKAFLEILIPQIMALSSANDILPSISFYIRRLIKLWIDHARTLLASSNDSFNLIYALISQLDENFTTVSLPRCEVVNQLTGAMKQLCKVMLPEISIGKVNQQIKIAELCLNTYAVTNIIQLTHRNLLYIFLSGSKKNLSTQPPAFINTQLTYDLLINIYTHLITKTKSTYENGVDDFSKLYSIKTALQRTKATCTLLTKNKTAILTQLNEETISRFNTILIDIEHLLSRLAKYDDQALFLKSDTAHHVSSSYFLVRNSLNRTLFDGENFNVNAFEDTKIEVNQRISQLKASHELRLSLELSFYLELMELLSYFSQIAHKVKIEKPEELRKFRVSFAKLRKLFQAQGRDTEISPIFNEIYSYINSGKIRRVKYLTFVIVMFF